MSDSIILEEEIDEDFEPTDEEIREYAQWLGMSLPEDEDLLYIAREGLKAPLPDAWKPCKTKDDEIYYFNFETAESVWEHPCDRLYQQKFLQAKKDRGKVKEAGSTSAQSIGNPRELSNQTPSNLSFGDVSSEFDMAYSDLDHQLSEELLNLRDEFDVKKKQELENFQKVIQDKKLEIDIEFQSEAQEFDKKQGQALKKRLDKLREESNQILQAEKDRILRDKEAKAGQLQQSHARMLEDEMNAIGMVMQGENLTFDNKDENSISEEIAQLNAELEYQKKRTQRQRDELTELESRLQQKIKRLKDDYELEVAQERRKYEKMLDEGASQRNSLGNDDIKQFEQSIQEKYDSDVREYKQQWEDKLERERQRIRAELNRKYASELEEFEQKLKRDYEQYKSELEQRTKEECELDKQQHHLRKKEELIQFTQELNKKLEGMQTSSSPADLQDRIANLQRELVEAIVEKQNKTMELQTLKAEESRLKGEVGGSWVWRRDTDDYRPQTARSKPPDPVDLSSHSRPDETTRQKDYSYVSPSPDKIDKLEREIETLKSALKDLQNKTTEYERPSVLIEDDLLYRWKSALSAERAELKEFQKLLEADQQKWKNDMKEVHLQHNEKKYEQLKHIKGILDKQKKRHNQRVKEFRHREQLMRRGDWDGLVNEQMYASDDLVMSDEAQVLDEWRYEDTLEVETPKYRNQTTIPRQAQYHQMHIYDKQLSWYSRQRNAMDDMIRKQSYWLNNVRAQLKSPIGYSRRRMY